MINLELVKESESIELKLVENSTGGTKNYNELENLPQINGVKLKGDLSLEDLGIIVNAVKDILINGASIIDKDGNANIPIANYGALGLVKTAYGLGVMIDASGLLNLRKPGVNEISSRTLTALPITCDTYDLAVKTAMCDGKGAEWTPQEKANARLRLGVGVWEEVIDVTIEEDVEYINIEFDKAYREIYVYVSQDGCEMKHTSGTRLIYPRLNRTIDHTDKNGHLMSYVSLNATYYDIVLIAKNHDNQWIERYTQCINPQKNTTSAGINAKYIDKGFHNKIDEYDELNFYGVYCNCTNKGTRIRVLGVRA